MREIVHIQAGQCGNQIGAKVSFLFSLIFANYRMGGCGSAILNQAGFS